MKAHSSRAGPYTPEPPTPPVASAPSFDRTRIKPFGQLSNECITGELENSQVDLRFQYFDDKNKWIKLSPLIFIMHSFVRNTS
jgi:hypothetical protein